MSEFGFGSTYMVGDEGKRNLGAGSKTVWNFQLSSDKSSVLLSFDISTGPDEENAPEWDVILLDSTGLELWSNYRSKNEVEIDVPNGKPRDLKLEVICPKGARYGDEVDIKVLANAKDDKASLRFEAVAIQSIIVLKTQMDQEKSVAESLYSKAITGEGEKDIYAIFCPAGLRGYIFVEGMNTDRLRDKTRDIRKARSFVEGETNIEEISHYLVPVSAVVGIVEGDLVELINGPFKGEIARVQQIDQNKEEITVELIEAMVPIPVTVKGDSVRVVEKEK